MWNISKYFTEYIKFINNSINNSLTIQKFPKIQVNLNLYLNF